MVVAVGDCARDFGVFSGAYGVAGAVADVVPVDVEIPGCPPEPAAIIVRTADPGGDVTTDLLVAMALSGLAAALSGATAPPRFRVGLSTALTVAACVFGLMSGSTFCQRPGGEGVHAALMPLSSFSLVLNRFGALFVVISAVIGICAMVFRLGYHGHGLSSRTASCILPLFVTTLLLVPAASTSPRSCSSGS